MAEAIQPVPAHIGQALAVVAATEEKEINPQSAANRFVATTLVFDPEGQPAYWANLILNQKQSFREAVNSVPDSEPVYLTGAARNRTFHGDVLTVKTFKRLWSGCPDCRFVVFSGRVFGLKGNQLYSSDGVLLQNKEATLVQNTFTTIKNSVTEGNLDKEMAKRWKKLEEMSKDAPVVIGPQTFSEEPPTLHLGSQFFRSRIGAQTITENDCLSYFLWSCTVRRVRGTLQVLGHDFGNLQRIRSDLGFLSLPDYQWGGRGNPPMVGTEYKTGQYVVGCGPMSVGRVLNWMRHQEGWSDRTIQLPSNGGSRIVNGSSSDPHFLQGLYWPTPIGHRTINGQNLTIHGAWLTERMGGQPLAGDTFVSAGRLLNGANAWLGEVGWPERVDGTWVRDLDEVTFAKLLVLTTYPLVLPPLEWIVWSQNSWRVGGVLKGSIGHRNRPAIALYTTDQTIPGTGILGFVLHYAPVHRFEILEYWDWSENYAWLYDGKEDPNYRDGTRRVYLSNYWDLSFGAYQVVKPEDAGTPTPTPTPPDGPRD